MAVVNSSPVISLAKIGKLELLKKIFNDVRLTEQVYFEIMKKPAYEEAIAINKAVEIDKWLKVNKSEKISEILGIGEASSISLALSLKQELIIDDRKAAFIAENLGIECHGTLFVVLEALKRKIIKNRYDAIEIVNQLVKNNLYLSSEILSEFYSLMNKI